MNARMLSLLEQLYSESVAADVAKRIERRLETVSVAHERPPRQERWSPSDILLITYADSFRGASGCTPLGTLGTFLRKWVADAVSQVHLLPFFPYTSDDGFAVSDYRVIDPENGTWADVSALAQDYELVFDYVVNHGSSEHPHFIQFLNDEAPGNRYFKTAPRDADVREVTRPRASALLQEFETKAGPRWVWCTFSRDQVDWDFSNPDVLFEFVDLLITYYERGASWLRVDAVAFLWKEIGTNCVHLPQTHAAVKLFRVVAEALSPDFKLLTETNVPLAENLSYFGAGDEAHIVYNFSLPPLLLHGLLTGRATHLTQWCGSLPPLPEGCTYLNFTASHDGVGLRPAEGILSQSEVEELVSCVRAFGGALTERRRPDGSLSPYEANIALYDALKGTVAGEDEWQTERFLLGQCLMLAMAGVPALYYNSLLAAPNYLEGLKETGRNRTINRQKWTIAEVEDRLADVDGAPRRVLDEIKRMLSVRRAQPAFHPEAEQLCLSLDPRVFALVRRSTTQRLICLFNLGQETIILEPGDLQSSISPEGQIIYGNDRASYDGGRVVLNPYAALWLEDPTP